MTKFVRVNIGAITSIGLSVLYYGSNFIFYVAHLFFILQGTFSSLCSKFLKIQGKT